MTNSRKGKSFIWLLALASFFSFAAKAALAAEPGAIELRAKATKVVVVPNADGTTRTEFVEPEIVVPGDKIAYTIAARNVSTEEVERVVITDPIPNEMLFVAGSIESGDATVLFSVDGGASFDREDKLTVVGEDGLPRPAMNTDYTHIRWVSERRSRRQRSGPSASSHWSSSHDES